MELSRSRRLLIGRLRRRKTREREQMFLAEGVRCASEVLDAGARVRFAVVSPRLHAQPAGVKLIERLEGARVQIIDATDADVAELADTESPQGVLLGCEQPSASLEAIKATRVLVADAIGDPGNLGALVRSAAAFGVSVVVALDGTVDPWNPKVVRASAGSIVRVTMLRASWPSSTPGARRVTSTCWWQSATVKRRSPRDAAGYWSSAVRHAVRAKRSGRPPTGASRFP